MSEQKVLLNEILMSLELKSNQNQILREIDKLDKLPESEIKANLKNITQKTFLNI